MSANDQRSWEAIALQDSRSPFTGPLEKLPLFHEGRRLSVEEEIVGVAFC